MIETYPVLDRATWLARRAEDLTASDIAAAVGLDRFKSPLALYAEKTKQIMAANDNVMMRRGRWMESAVLAAICDEEPDWEVRKVGLYYRDRDLRLGATPDFVAITDEEGVTNIQAKVVSKPVYEREWSEGPPMAYTLQTLTEGLLMDAQRSLIAALVVDAYSAELYLHRVPRHAAAEARIQGITRQFWKNVAEGKRPAVDHVRDADLIEELHPVSVPEPVLDLTGDNHMTMLLAQRAATKSVMKDFTDELLRIDTEIKAKLGDHQTAVLRGWKVHWKTHQREERIVPAGSYRALRVVEVKEEEAA